MEQHLQPENPASETVDPQWALLNSWVEGELDETSTSALGMALERDPLLAAEAGALRRLLTLIDTLKIAPPAGFTDEVMARVRTERPAARAVWTALAAAVLLFVAGAWLLGGLAREASWLDGVRVLAEGLISVLLTGAGLVDASWQGAGAVVASWFGAAAGNLAIAGISLVAVNALLIVLLRSRWRAARERRRS